MKENLKCWKFFECKEKLCPVYESKELRCWLVSETHCRNEIQGKFLEKMEMCLNCEPFKANMNADSMEETLKVIDKQFRNVTALVKGQDGEVEGVSMELAMGLSEVFEALKQISSGDPSVRLPEASSHELVRRLKHMVNMTAKELGEIVDLSHEFAIGLAEHFDVLHRVSRGDLAARISGSSQVELLGSLKEVTNQMIASVSDEITGRKQAEKKMAHAEKLARYGAELEDFSQSVSLRIREVISEVRADFHELEPHVSPDFQNRQSLVDRVMGLQGLITNVVWYTASKAKIQKLEKVNSSMILFDVKRDLEADINRLNATVNHDSLPTVLFNREKLFILFRCLLGNAVKFHGQNAPTVSIKAQQEDSKWIFSIQDNGTGIHSTYIDTVFNVWSRTHNATQYPGEGIGLAICKNILENNNERIWVDSEPGKGSTFYFTVPATGDRG